MTICSDKNNLPCRKSESNNNREGESEEYVCSVLLQHLSDENN